MNSFRGFGGPGLRGGSGGPRRDFEGPLGPEFDRPHPPHHPPYRRQGYGLGSLLLTGLVAAAAGTLISKASQNKTKTNKNNDDDGFIW